MNQTTLRFLELLDHQAAGGVTEVCVFQDGDVPTHAGYFDNAAAAAKAIALHDGRGNIFVSLNPVKGDLLARANNRLIEGSFKRKLKRTRDTEVWRDSWLLLDVDPKRPSGISSSDAELAAAVGTGSAVGNWLLDSGVPATALVTAKSGNGCYLLVRLPDYEVTAERIALKQAFVNHVADLFSNEEVEIDRTVYNPARLIGALGAKKVKGENIPARPHRRSSIGTVGGEKFDAQSAQRCEPFDLYALAAKILPPVETQAKKTNATAKKANGERVYDFDIRTVTDELANEKTSERGFTYYDCPNCGGTQKLFVTDSGAYGCFHIGAGLCSYRELGAKLRELASQAGKQNQQAAQQQTNAATANAAPAYNSVGDDAVTGGSDDDDSDDNGPKESLSQTLINLALDNAELFHDSGGDGFATVTINDHRETYKLSSRDFKDWLAGLLYSETGKAASGDKIGEAVTVLRAKARYEAPKAEVHVRVAEHAGAIYLDLCNEDWQQVEINEHGWRVIESKDSAVRFRRAGGMLPLPVPVRGGELSELRELLNLPADDTDNWPLLLGELVAAFKPCNETRFAYPLLAIHGEQGSAKSTTCRLLRRLVDPNKADLRATPKDERDLAIAAEHGRVLAFDNLTYLSDSLSNALCRIATGGGFATRELFTDEGEVIFDSQRPVFLNGIAEVVAKSDLLDRAILIYLPRIDKRKRKLDRVIDREFAAAQPRVLGCLLDAVSTGLRRLREGVHLEELPRMADFAEWVMACEPGLGLADGQFMKAYQSNQEKANGLAIEASPVAQAIVALIGDCHEFEGTTGGLLKALNGRLTTNGENPKHKQSWPQSPRALGAKLKEIAPNLRRSGVEVAFGDRGRSGYTITLAKMPPGKEEKDVHDVHDVHAPNADNDLDREHWREQVPDELPEMFTDEDYAPPREHLADAEKADVHANVHTLNGYKQKAGEHREHREHLPLPTAPAAERVRFEI